MALLGAAIIGFLVGLVFCYWKQLQSVYENRDTLSAIGDVKTGVSGLQTLYQKI